MSNRDKNVLFLAQLVVALDAGAVNGTSVAVEEGGVEFGGGRLGPLGVFGVVVAGRSVP